jgi:hypothetical protein
MSQSCPLNSWGTGCVVQWYSTCLVCARSRIHPQHCKSSQTKIQTK